MAEFIDQIGHTITLKKPVRRIISLVPSQTELLFALGQGDKVIGVTKFCVHPKEACRTKIIIGGTKQLHIDRIISLAPDFIIANKEENNQDDILALQQICPVWTSDIITLASSYEMILTLGGILGCEDQCRVLVEEIQKSLMPPPLKRSALYFIWQNPWMVAGRATFIHHMMEAAGFSNAASTLDDSRYPVLTKDEILALRPEVILLSSEPFPFRSSHASTIALQMSPSEVLLVDGEMFSWYGSRMGLAGSYFASLKKDKK